MKNDPRAYLGRMGMPKGVSKAAELTAKAAASGRVPVASKGQSKPDGNARSLPVSKAAVRVDGSTCGKGALGSMSEHASGRAKRANIEGNESAKYERLERKTLKGLKGSVSTVLRAGHNTSGTIDRKMAKSAAKESQAHERGESAAMERREHGAPSSAKAKAKVKKTMGEFKRGTLHSGSKKGPKVTSRKQAIAIALNQSRKEK